MATEYLRENWQNLTAPYGSSHEGLFEELVRFYGDPARHYHTLHHVEALLKLSEQYRDRLTHPESVDFAIWYHDVIYDATRQDNELRSAELATLRLTQLGVSSATAEACYNLILATKTHTSDTPSFDMLFLLDIDLSILAAEPDAYRKYTEQIREEYAMYPAELYREGRKKVLQHFLDMKTIFKTELFVEKWEARARENLEFELQSI